MQWWIWCVGALAIVFLLLATMRLRQKNVRLSDDDLRPIVRRQMIRQWESFRAGMHGSMGVAVGAFGEPTVSAAELADEAIRIADEKGVKLKKLLKTKVAQKYLTEAMFSEKFRNR